VTDLLITHLRNIAVIAADTSSSNSRHVIHMVVLPTIWALDWEPVLIHSGGPAAPQVKDRLVVRVSLLQFSPSSTFECAPACRRSERGVLFVHVDG
jgi:hypothetical protein